MRSLLLPLMINMPFAALAAENMECFGEAPNWAFVLEDGSATLDYLRISELSLTFTTIAEGADWPQAHTFIGRGDTAIVILEAAGEDKTNPVRILTQRGETPLLLIGTCALR